MSNDDDEVIIITSRAVISDLDELAEDAGCTREELVAKWIRKRIAKKRKKAADCGG